MKSEVELWLTCLCEAGQQYHVRTLRDAEYAVSRIEKEGLSFLTITLPRFEKDFLQSISRGRVGSDLFLGFSKTRGGLPKFLSGFLRRIFDTDGVLRVNFDAGLIKAVRQVTLLLSKIELEVSQDRKDAAIRRYIDTDMGLKDVHPVLLNKIRSTARFLFAPFFSEIERRIYERDWVPGHSSGALATRETPNGRWNNATWTERLQNVLPWWDELCTVPSEIQFSDCSVLTPEQEPAAKLVLVPKTMKTPRVIVEEPVYNQYVQQGVLDVIVQTLRKPRYKHLYDAFSWDSQVPNRELAREGSISGSYATIDLSEASDRVSSELVWAVLDSAPYLRSVVFASRSERVTLGERGELHLRKFASMGSSLCFPFESMVFFTIVLIGIAEACSVAPSAVRKSLVDSVRIYGDDIIVPVEVAQIVVELLEAYGLKVNADKTFTTGHFRESCGSEWFRGTDVSVFRVRQILPRSRRNIEHLRCAIELHNRALLAGYENVAEHVARVCDSIRHVPRAPVGADVAAIWTYDDQQVRFRHSSRYHRREVRCLIFREVVPRDSLDGYGALKKFLHKRTEHPLMLDHLERSGRSRCAGIHIGWMACP